MDTIVVPSVLRVDLMAKLGEAYFSTVNSFITFLANALAGSTSAAFFMSGRLILPS